jgi:hypothetical protein
MERLTEKDHDTVTCLRLEHGDLYSVCSQHSGIMARKKHVVEAGRDILYSWYAANGACSSIPTLHKSNGYSLLLRCSFRCSTSSHVPLLCCALLSRVTRANFHVGSTKYHPRDGPHSRARRSMLLHCAWRTCLCTPTPPCVLQTPDHVAPWYMCTHHRIAVMSSSSRA